MPHEPDDSSSLDGAADRSGADDDRPLEEALGAAEEDFGLVEGRETVEPALARLTERERRISYLRFLRNMTQSAIIAELGVPPVHISRLLSNAVVPG
ncbi:sigma factor-like helix-turn-helix DNA-binding protein [Streptomyces sp. Ac-502]|uniref:sigma factor-like helix-turn-helix DNA-binding protein n=1 Tax=Streptomyces sp. Ac-502 TaxID=3342801 RepID=UPI003862641B